MKKLRMYKLSLDVPWWGCTAPIINFMGFLLSNFHGLNSFENELNSDNIIGPHGPNHQIVGQYKGAH